jgi:hypothetical protein
MLKLDIHERAAIFRRLAQIEQANEAPKITDGQKDDLVRERGILNGKIQQDDLLE